MATLYTCDPILKDGNDCFQVYKKNKRIGIVSLYALYEALKKAENTCVKVKNFTFDKFYVQEMIKQHTNENTDFNCSQDYFNMLRKGV